MGLTGTPGVDKVSTPTITAAGTNSVKGYGAVYFAPEQIPDVWEELETLLLPALEKCQGELTMATVRNLLETGQMNALGTIRENRIELALVTEFVKFPNYKSIRVVLCGGKNLAQAMHEFMPAFTEWVLVNGAVEIEAWAPDEKLTVFYEWLGFSRIYTVNRINLRGKLQ
jgi:hypothetical protein